MNEVAELHRISVIYVLSFLVSGETPPRPGRGAQGPEPPSAPEECTEDHPISPHQTPSRGPGMSVCAHWRSWIVFPSVLLRCFNEQHPKSRKEIKRSRKQLTCSLCVGGRPWSRTWVRFLPCIWVSPLSWRSRASSYWRKWNKPAVLWTVTVQTRSRVSIWVCGTVDEASLTSS